MSSGQARNTSTPTSTTMPYSHMPARMESLAIPSQARRRPAFHSRQSSSQSSSANLRLPSLPRFHPANFASSQHSSGLSTPATNPNSPQPPLSPRTHQKQYSDVQRQMYAYQQQLMANAARQNRGPAVKPSSPRLNPLESPGPVTPMELEGADGYLTAHMNSNDAVSHVDKLIREEAHRRGDMSPGRVASVGGR